MEWVLDISKIQDVISIGQNEAESFFLSPSSKTSICFHGAVTLHCPSPSASGLIRAHALLPQVSELQGKTTFTFAS